VYTDLAGEARVIVGVRTAGAVEINASLSNGSQVKASVVGRSTSLDILALRPRILVREGFTGSLSLPMRVTSLGSPAAGANVTFQIVSGSGRLSAGSGTTDASGLATTVYSNSGGQTTEATVWGCLASQSTSCVQMRVVPVAPRNLALRVMEGAEQVIASGQAAAISVRLTDTATPVSPVASGTVDYVATYRAGIDALAGSTNDRGANSKILGVATGSLITDEHGNAGFVPDATLYSGALTMDVQFTAGFASASTTVFRLR
jgi:hypothetical protein